MAMAVSREEFLGVDVLPEPSADVVASKMALDFEAEVFLRMKELDIKQKDLAELLGVSPAAVSKALAENSNLTFKTAAKIAVALGCDLGAPKMKPFGEAEAVIAESVSEALSRAIERKEPSASALKRSLAKCPEAKPASFFSAPKQDDMRFSAPESGKTLRDHRSEKGALAA